MRLTVIAASLVLGLSSAMALEYPVRPVTLVVPFPIGGQTDLLARLAARALARQLGQPVLVENVGGAGGTVGSARVTKAPPDGYTLLIHHIGMASAETLYRQLPYQALTDLAPVGLVSETPMVLLARADFPPDTLSTLVSFAQTQHKWVTFAHGGIGAASHLCSILFQTRIDASLIAVGYRGTGQVLHNILGGHVDLACESANAAMSVVGSQRVKAYGVTGEKRLAGLPGVPTAEEAGLQGLDIRIWHGLFVPAGVPAEVVQTLSSALRGALKDPELIRRFGNVATEPVAEEKATPAALKAALVGEINRWSPMLRAGGQYVD